MVMGIRVTEEEEYLGMDVVDCGIEAYPSLSALNLLEETTRAAWPPFLQFA